ncbi:GNAT family N-acetyltransferase [Paenibacillus sp. HN-1]|uniref:GNAT family N-acetyltransferase n=1 Tax=Paenibacillus TaxID=44249 RepID=UPI001CA974D7|nr:MULTISPECIES: GNAT family N-acetyltransferase [Paenibacillus]MBY9082080.1 GNAT family N-acetyltransferase [Paenibacillus sp. CGMCC 1.18879]MBY9085762.1 GNAT family N-acetyltransferase [Paenibacillus sinensis]
MSLPNTGEIETSIGHLAVRRVQEDQTEAAVKLLRDAAGWMQTTGLTQWNPDQFTDGEVRRYFTEREVYMAFKDDIPAAVFTLQFGDPQYWGGRNDDRYAYLHRLAVALPFRGSGIGGELLKYAAVNAKACGHQGLRLDTIEYNVKLNRYYQTQGFRYMGTNDAGGGRLVNLYEKIEDGDDVKAIRLQYFAEPDFGVLASWSASAESLKQWAGPSLHFPLPQEELAEYIREANRPAVSGLLAYSAVHSASGRIIGHISLAGIDRDNGHGRIGRVVLAPDSRGQGYGRRMMAEAMRIGFEGLKLHRLALGVFDFNASAISLYESLGFRREGEQVEAARFGDRYVNLIDMAMLDREWKEIRGSIFQ